MSTSKGTIDFLFDQLSNLAGLGHKKMFGEYCIYLHDRPIGFVCDDQLYLKYTEAGRIEAPQVEEGIPYTDGKPHLLITADLWEDRDWLTQLIQTTFNALPTTTIKRKKTHKGGVIQRV